MYSEADFSGYFINKLAYCMLYLMPHSSTILQNSLLKISAYLLVNSSGLTFVFVCRRFLNLLHGIDLVLLMWMMQMTMQGRTLLALYVGRVIAPPCQQQTVKEPLKYLCLLLDNTAKGENSKLCFMHPLETVWLALWFGNILCLLFLVLVAYRNLGLDLHLQEHRSPHRNDCAKLQTGRSD